MGFSHASAAMPFLCDQLPVPAQQRVQRHNSVELQQRFTAHRFRLPCEQCPLGVSETNPLAAQLVFQKSVLGL
jgi:hypothetical protein